MFSKDHSGFFYISTYQTYLHIDSTPSFFLINIFCCMFLLFFSLDGRQTEGGHMSEVPASSDKPLAQASSSPISYAGSVQRRADSTTEDMPTQPTGKPEHSAAASHQTSTTTCTPNIPVSPVRLESYATVTQKGKGGPQEVGLQPGYTGISEIDIILSGIGN